MQRDVSSGTALQEISFWVNMEHALGRLRGKRDSPEVVLTLEVLKAGKRFHTTISFDSDTGLTDTQERVNDYLQLMKDFPIKDLLAADSLATVISATSSIFLHLKKVRNTNYPTERAVALVEAISRDLLSQLLKSLSVHKLMLVTYQEFEQIIGEAFEVFTAWKDELERFKFHLRELAKRKTLKFHFKFNLAHEKLEARLTQMKE